MKKAVILILAAACALSAGLSGCSDSGTNSNLSKLVGTWWYQSATLDGVPYDWFGYYSGDIGDTASYTFNADRTWNRIVYGVSLDTVQIAEGTFIVDGDSLTTTMTTLDGNPLIDPIVMGYTYTVTDSLLAITVSTETGGGITEVYVITYKKD